jgi:hypothetical protein
MIEIFSRTAVCLIIYMAMTPPPKVSPSNPRLGIANVARPQVFDPQSESSSHYITLFKSRIRGKIDYSHSSCHCRKI